jgi:hypothetical protein
MKKLFSIIIILLSLTAVCSGPSTTINGQKVEKEEVILYQTVSLKQSDYVQSWHDSHELIYSNDSNLFIYYDDVMSAYNTTYIIIIKKGMLFNNRFYNQWKRYK